MKILKKYKYHITLLLFILLIISIITTKNRLKKEEYQNIESINSEISMTSEIEKEDIKKECIVDIKGAVNNPGVYKTSCDSTVFDVIKLAGDLTDNANTSVTNLAKKINNEMVIIIYTDDEVKNSNVVDTVVKVIEKECVCPNIKNDSCINDKINSEISNTEDSIKLVNINTANAEELMKVPGIGESKAKAIIDYRDKNGSFKTVEDIQNVTGIGSKLYEEIKVYITT